VSKFPHNIGLPVSEKHQEGDMREIIIDEEFKSLLPPLDMETFALLEENLLEHGCRDALVIWKGILIDGHNRYEICMMHEIPFNTVEKEFGSREEVLIWIISTQVSRRNLSPIQLSHYRGLHYRADRRIQGTNNQFVNQGEKRQNVVFQSSTSKRLAEKYRVSHKTIERDAKVAAAIDSIGEASPEAKRKILSGEVSIDKKVLEGLASRPKEDVVDIAYKIEEGVYEKKKSEAPATAGISDSANLDSSGMRPFEAAIARITEELFSELRKQAKNGDTSELKSALRSYIDMLEDMYSQI